ncbi:MAG: hypothetical protein LC104_01045 [Bacteroidales bacterium]|nr:hypothetical protein [Bacteroidales bacterium]
MDYADHLAVIRSVEPTLAEAIAHIRNLEDILGWIPRENLTFTSVDLVQQDEYSYDFLVPWHDGRRCLAFGLT